MVETKIKVGEPNYADAYQASVVAAAVGIKPPSSLPAWKWMEANIVLDSGSVVPGQYSTAFTPMVRFVCDEYQKRTTRSTTLMVSAQSAKTQLILNLFNWIVNEDPGPAMWVMANADMMGEFLKKRLFPNIENCAPTAEKLPKDRRRLERGLILFDTMFLVMRGSNSRSKLQSDPIRHFFFDEVREWKPGAIDLVRKRARTFHNSTELAAGTAGTMNDELHTMFKAGSQTLFHWTCPECKASQSFRFSQCATTVFSEPRERGGVRWDENETTRPGGVWDYEKLKETVRYECESCEHRFYDRDKQRLLLTLHPVDYNPSAPPQRKSFHWNALYMPWPSCGFGEIAEEFLKAREAQKLGNDSPMITFVTETLGEPYRSERETQMITPAIGDGIIAVADEYFRCMTIDVQKRDFWYVIRAWWKTGASKMIACGHVDNEQALEELRKKHKVLAMLTAIDSGYDTEGAYRICHQFGARFRGQWYPWKAFKGQRQDYYTEVRDGKRLRRLFQASVTKTTLRVPLWLIATTGCKDILTNLRDGRGAKWEALPNLPADYLEQINSETKQSEYKDGRENFFYDKVNDKRRNEFWDCEAYQIALASWMGVFDVR